MFAPRKEGVCSEVTYGFVSPLQPSSPLFAPMREFYTTMKNKSRFNLDLRQHNATVSYPRQIGKKQRGQWLLGLSGIKAASLLALLVGHALVV